MTFPTIDDLLDHANKMRHQGEDALANALIEQAKRRAEALPLPRRVDSDVSPRDAVRFLPSEPPPAPSLEGRTIPLSSLVVVSDDLAAHIAETDRLLDEAEAAVLALPEEPAPTAYPRFVVDGSARRWTLAEMEQANQEDDAVLTWLWAAKVGDVLDTMHGATITRVA